MADGMQKDWHELCLALTNETDPVKLSLLAQDLIEALDKGERSWRHPVSPSGEIPTNQQATEESLHG